MASVPTSTGGFDLGQFLSTLAPAGLDIYSLFSKQGPKDAATAINIADPLLALQPTAQTQMSQFLADPSSVLQDPAFQAAQKLGAEDISRQEGAKGMAGSGNRLADLFSFGQASGLGFEQQKFNQLMGLLQGNQGAANLYMGGQQDQNKTVADLLSQLFGGGGVAGLAGMLPALFKGIFGGGGGGGSGSIGTGQFTDISQGIGTQTNVPDNTVPSGFTPGNSDVPPATDWTSGSDLPSGIDWSSNPVIDWTSGFDLGGG